MKVVAEIPGQQKAYLIEVTQAEINKLGGAYAKVGDHLNLMGIANYLEYVSRNIAWFAEHVKRFEVIEQTEKEDKSGKNHGGTTKS